MTASQRRTVTVVVAALGAAFVLVWAAVVGPDDLARHRVEPSSQQSADHHRDTEQGSADQQQAPPDDQPSHAANIGPWVRDLATVVVVAALLFLIVLLGRQLSVAIGRRITDERFVVPLDPLPDLDAARAAVQRDQESQRAALASPDVRNGIVACWVLFEEAAAESQVARQPAETASAFVVRFLHSLDVDPRPVAELARLFLEARFSTHPMPEDARPRAEHALAAIHRDLAGAGAPT